MSGHGTNRRASEAVGPDRGFAGCRAWTGGWTGAWARARNTARIAFGVLVVAVADPVAARAQAGPTREPVASGSDDLHVYGHADWNWRIRGLGEDEPVRLDAFRGRVLFINLWASWCIPCVREMGSIERLRERLEDTGIVFLAVAADREAAVRRFLRRHGHALPVYLEETRIPASFGLRGLPTTWVVDGAGRIVLLRHGEAVWDTDEVEAFLRSLAERGLGPG